LSLEPRGPRPRLAPGTAALTALGALVAGGMLYVTKRPTSLLMFAWAESFGLGEHVARCRAHTASLQLPKVLVQCAPQALWAFALVLLVRVIWFSRQGVLASACIAFASFVAVAPEVAQGAGVVPGTFDRLDLLLVVLALGFASLVHLERGGRNHRPMCSGGEL
jgi:hypothetical protein